MSKVHLFLVLFFMILAGCQSAETVEPSATVVSEKTEELTIAQQTLMVAGLPHQILPGDSIEKLQGVLGSPEDVEEHPFFELHHFRFSIVEGMNSHIIVKTKNGIVSTYSLSIVAEDTEALEQLFADLSKELGAQLGENTSLYNYFVWYPQSQTTTEFSLYLIENQFDQKTICISIGHQSASSF